MNFSLHTQLAVKAAKKASNILIKGFGDIKSSRVKGDKGLVTNFDVEAEKVIKSVLLSKTDYQIIGEETGLEGSESSYKWIVDPIDGTTNFAYGIPLFSTSIALVKDEVVVAGVVFNPVHKEIYVAERGKGTFLNNKRVSTVNVSKKVVFVNSGYAPEDERLSNSAADRLVGKIYRRKFGSTALECAYVAAGRAQAIFTVGDEFWDYAAGIILINEAGGNSSDWKGNDVQSASKFLLSGDKETVEMISREIGSLQ